MERNIYKIGKDLFITSDEEIKEGDWILYANPNSKRTFVVKCTEIASTYFDYERKTLEIRQIPIKWAKRIILTTDQYLIKDGVQAIDDAFLEWFVKNPNCEEVKIRKIENEWIYNTDVPQEEPKQESLDESAEKWYDSTEENKGFPKMQAFKDGAKWQAERIVWSEEAVIELLHSRMRYTLGVDYKEVTTLEWFEQFKKK
jgi:hypothetical protein